MVKAVGDDNKAEVTFLSGMSVVYNEGLDCRLGIIPMIALCSVLEDKGVILRKIGLNQQLAWFESRFAFIEESALLFCNKRMRNK